MSEDKHNNMSSQNEFEYVKRTDFPRWRSANAWRVVQGQKVEDSKEYCKRLRKVYEQATRNMPEEGHKGGG